MTLIFQNVTAVFECIPLFFGISKKTTLKPPEVWNSGTQEKQRKIGTKAATVNLIAYGNIFNQIKIKDRYQGSKKNIVLGVDAKAFSSFKSSPIVFFPDAPCQINWAACGIRFFLSPDHKLPFPTHHKSFRF